MRKFGTTLRKCIESRGYTLYNFAKQYGIDRTLLQKYISEARKPKDVEEVNNIAMFLGMSDKETSDLIEKYFILKYGVNKFESFRSIENILEEKKEALCTDNSPCKLFADKVCNIVSEEIRNTLDKCICVICQPDNILIKVLYETFVHCNNNVRMEQIMCFGYGMSSDVNNVDFLHNIIQYVMSGGEYKGFCYYGDIRKGWDNMELFPVTIVMPEAIIRCDADTEQIVMHYEKDIIAIIREHYDYMKEQCELAFVTKKNRRCCTKIGGGGGGIWNLEKYDDRLLIYGDKKYDMYLEVTETSILKSFEEYELFVREKIVC